MASPEHSEAQTSPASVNNSKYISNNKNNGSNGNGNGVNSHNNNNNNNNINNNKNNSANGSHGNHGHDLSHSLNKLSISISPKSISPKSISPKSESNSPPNTANGRPRSAIPPNPRAPVRSPLTRANINRMTSDSPLPSPGLMRKTSMNSLRSVTSGTPIRSVSRRGSSNSFLSPTAARSPTTLHPNNGEMMEDRPSRTPASIASGYLAKELELLHGTGSGQSSETIVILHDDCYGHRYSRPRASKNLLGTIVERPERIQASVVGVSMAYVRLGERHCDGKNPIHPDLDPMSLPGIPFRIHKTTRKLPISSAAVTNVHGNKWMDELKVMCDSAEEKLALNGNELRRPEMNRGPDAEPPQQFHQGDLYLCPESLNAFEGALGAVCEAVDAVFSTSPHRRAFVAVRPPGHHCSASFPSGFCWLNNVHVGIMHGILNHGLTHAAIIDFDLHHGDGSQAIAWQHNKRGLAKNVAAWKKTSIGYFSVHDINSYPCEYGDEEKIKNASLCIDNAHGQNIWNVHLQEWKSEVDFWKLYQSKYSILLEKTRNYLRLQTERFQAAGQVPKAAIFLSAGFDASEWEGAGMQRHKVNVPTSFYARLTRDVVQIASDEGLSVDGRVISVLEGGYSDRALYSGVLSHLSGLAGDGPVAPKEGGAHNPELEPGLSSGGDGKPLKACESLYDPSWWSAAELDIFDAAKMAPPPPEPRKLRTVTIGNYSSPTQSSNAKMTDVAKMRHGRTSLPSSQIVISRSPTPPPPDIPWTTVAHELSKLLIPNNRQIDSCTYAELNADAIKAKKDRQSLQTVSSDASDVAPTAPTRMSLRERKPVSYLEDDDHHSRRRTVAGSGAPATSKGQSRGAVDRRLSTASSMSTIAGTQMPISVATRPITSLSVRPTSSISVRDQASNTINVRKTRPPAPSKKVSNRAPRVPRKTEPATSTAEMGPPSINAPNEDVLPQLSKSIVAPTRATPTAMAPPKDMDQITNGMKKIKINVLTKEQKAARLKAQAETPEEEVPPKEQISSPPSVNEAYSHPSSSDTGSLYGPTTPVGIEASFPHDHATPTEPKAETMIPMTPTIISPTEASPSSAPFVSSPLVRSPPEPVMGTDLFIPYQPDGPPPSTIPIQRPIHILEPNTGTPARPNTIQLPKPASYSVPVSPVRKGHGFTATSNIPFSHGPAPCVNSASNNGIHMLPRPSTASKNASFGPRGNF